MKKVVMALMVLVACATAEAQNAYSDNYGEGSRPGLFDRKKKQQQADAAAVNRALYGDNSGKTQTSGQGKVKEDKKAIDEKYLAGACPEVNGKVQWETTINVPGASAQQVYDRALAFMKLFVKEKEHTMFSNVSLADDKDLKIGVRVQEWLVFENRPLSLDRTKFNYTLAITCHEGKCHVVMRNMSYVYEEERGGGQMPAEDMLCDREALNKTKDGFQKGGHKKFRTKTIDRKDMIFSRIEDMLVNR